MTSRGHPHSAYKCVNQLEEETGKLKMIISLEVTSLFSLSSNPHFPSPIPPIMVRVTVTLCDVT